VTSPTITSGSTPITAPELRVAVGLVRDAYGRVLITQRHRHVHLGGLWEYPGGKCEPGESAAAALVREFREELGLEILSAAPILNIPFVYPEHRVRLLVFRVTAWRGEPRALEGQNLRWATRAELLERAFPPANRPITAAARLPALYWITPGPRTTAEVSEGVERISERLAAGGVALLQIRAPNLPARDYIRFARALIERAGEYRCEVLVNAPDEWRRDLPPAGCHLTEARLRALGQRYDRTQAPGATCRSVFTRHSGPVQPLGLTQSPGLAQRPDDVTGWLAASVHDAEGLACAARVGVDFVCLSPVRRTQTHPDALPLGFDAFAQLCAVSACPVYALGGMQVTDLPAVQARGGQGIAAISGLVKWHSSSG